MLIKFLSRRLSVLALLTVRTKGTVWTPPPPISIYPMQARKRRPHFPPLTACATATPILKQRNVMRPSKFISPRGRRCCLGVLPLMFTQSYANRRRVPWMCPVNRLAQHRLRGDINHSSTTVWLHYEGNGVKPRFEAAKGQQYDDGGQDNSVYLALGHPALYF